MNKLQIAHIVSIVILMVTVPMPCVGQQRTDDALRKMRKINPQMPAPIQINPQRVAASGIQVFRGQHVEIYTDIRGRNDIGELTRVFDAAVPAWCDYFQIDRQKASVWKLRGYVFANDQSSRQRFRQAGLFPSELPDFPAGYNRGHEMWVFLQEGNYYTRHLLLHEGTHGFMQWFLGGTGAPWFSEGMAELLGLHRWSDQKLKINYRVRDAQESDNWGRVKIIKEEVADGTLMSLDDIFAIGGSDFREVRFYAWSWAACEFFSKHDLTKDLFARFFLIANKRPERFQVEFSRALQPHRTILDRDWQLFVKEMEYGFEINRGKLHELKTGSRNRFELRTDIAWQQTEFSVRKGETIDIAARGRYVVSKREFNQKIETWPCEADGITIEYYRGRPVGSLLATVVGSDQIIDLDKAVEIGSRGQFVAERDGFVCLRINESPARMEDNEGRLTVAIRKKP